MLVRVNTVGDSYKHMARPTAQRKPAEERAAPNPGLKLDGLTELLGFHLRMAHVALYRDFIASLKAVDLTQKQAAVLTLIEANPGCSQIALAGTLGADRATMMAIVDRLQDRSLLYRTRSTVDRRRQELYLTDEGTAVLHQAQSLIAEHEARFAKRFTAQEFALLKDMLGRIEVD